MGVSGYATQQVFDPLQFYSFAAAFTLTYTASQLASATREVGGRGSDIQAISVIFFVEKHGIICERGARELGTQWK